MGHWLRASEAVRSHFEEHQTKHPSLASSGGVWPSLRGTPSLPFPPTCFSQQHVLGETSLTQT